MAEDKAAANAFLRMHPGAMPRLQPRAPSQARVSAAGLGGGVDLVVGHVVLGPRVHARQVGVGIGGAIPAQ